MYGFYIKHITYDKYFGFTKDNRTIWTTLGNAHKYCTLLNAQAALNDIKKYPKYKNALIEILKADDIERAI